MNDKISLRNATEDDYDLMYQIKENSIKPYVELVWGWEENFQRQFLKENTSYKEVKFILFENEVAGFIQTKENEDEIFIGSLFITTDFQKKGIGTYLLSEIFKQNKTVSLEVLKLNTGAINLYKRMNFKVWKEDELKYFMKYTP
ncbi:hypothetical protein A9P82_01945 [Arachidicoccus ginsenosidimutans]|uniref:GNAT family N-acetyltransferase n=1 Tax=Arachidicoccus sp. BS20 TaxID=1850526 RepID=UPI0007F15F9E|nr:GNAT family N-acetyltransferase [Arachidicoccus sp. BS20]ANI88180.1 hypothetical protein A9P82_01945 [Arachidicoccus sp. BS20]